MSLDTFPDEPSEFLFHSPCEVCGSSDARAVYDNDTSYCFSCGDYQKSALTGVEKPAMKNKTNREFLDVTYKALSKRGITLETARHWNYGLAEYQGEKVQVANYYDNHGDLKAQKVRFKDKDFSIIGDLKACGLYGQHLCRDKGKVVITEGEIDALSISQAIGLKWNVVSLPSGAQSAKKTLSKNIEWLSKFDEIILMFDNDEVGKKAALEAAEILPPSKAKIASLPLKDANEMVQANRIEELVQAYWGAKEFRPDGILNGSDLWEEIINEEEQESSPYPYEDLNEKLGGFRKGEIVTLTAGSGIGKSQLAREVAYKLIKDKETLGYIALEESVKRTAIGLMSLDANHPIHLDKGNFEEEALKEFFDNTVGNGNVFLYDHWGSTEGDNLLSKIRYLVVGCGCKYIVLDHISIVVSGLEGGDERRIIDNTMTKLRALVEELNFGLLLISHLRRPSGDKGHEEGCTTSLSQLRGSAAIAQLSDIVIGLERNQQDSTHANISHVRILKNRWSGETGLCCSLEYVKETGRMVPVVFEEEDETVDF